MGVGAIVVVRVGHGIKGQETILWPTILQTWLQR